MCNFYCILYFYSAVQWFVRITKMCGSKTKYILTPGILHGKKFVNTSGRSSGAKRFLLRTLLDFFVMLQKGLFKMLQCPRHRSGILIYHIITHLVIVHNVVQVRCISFFTCLPFTRNNQMFRTSKSF